LPALSRTTLAVALGVLLLMSELVLPPVSLAAPARRKPVAGEWWMGVYLGESKLGHVQITVAPARGLRGGGYRIRTTTWTRALALGYVQEQRVEVDEHLSRDLRPVTLKVHMGSAGKQVEVKARFHETVVEVERRAQDDVVRKSLPIPEGAHLVADVESALLGHAVAPGESLHYFFLNTVTLSLEEATARVVRRERVRHDGEEYDTVVVQTTSPTVDATSWLLDDGQPVKMVMHPGITLVRESREKALSGFDDRASEPIRDLAEQLAVQMEGSITAPESTRFLRLRLRGLPERRFVLSDARQVARIVEEGDALTVEYTVDATAAHPAPLTPAERAALLAPSAYLQVTHPDIQAKATEIVAGATSDDARIQALWAWVHGNLRIQGDIGLPRTALDVLREPVGMCRDYATLYAALARAVGIPTRVCAGIVYFRDRFYYHAWAESYAEGCWVPVDPTVAPGFVDATHIKFTQGDAATMYGAVKSIGRLHATILEQR